MLLSIIVVNWNTCELTTQCLKSVFAHPPAVAYEVIVVDNASADESVTAIESRFPEVRLIRSVENKGYAGGNNQGICASKGKYCFLLNSDAIVTPGAIDAMIDFLERHPQVGAAGPTLLNPDGSFQGSFAQFPSLWSEVSLFTGIARWTIGPNAPSPRPKPGSMAEQVDWVAGAAIMVRRSTIDQVGHLDESYALYSEETDLCWRMRRAGWQIWYLPDVNIIHIGGASTNRKSTECYSRLYRSKVHFFRLAYGLRSAVCLSMVLIFLAVSRIGVRMLALPFLSSASRMANKVRIRLDLSMIHHLGSDILRL
ncbi:MAG: glycosyltransferase family 2 protein [Anaerolineae bacterium]|nr:glycosyltransferase family 2 protein [Anaerolineae bacterium]